MNPKPIEQANDAVLRFSLPALQRAALRAREVAWRTGTAVVVVRDGALEYQWPDQEGNFRSSANALREASIRQDAQLELPGDVLPEEMPRDSSK